MLPGEDPSNNQQLSVSLQKSDRRQTWKGGLRPARCMGVIGVVIVMCAQHCYHVPRVPQIYKAAEALPSPTTRNQLFHAYELASSTSVAGHRFLEGEILFP